VERSWRAYRAEDQLKSITPQLPRMICFAAITKNGSANAGKIRPGTVDTAHFELS